MIFKRVRIQIIFALLSIRKMALYLNILAILKLKFKKIGPLIFYLPLRFRKAGRVWCGGARETQ